MLSTWEEHKPDTTESVLVVSGNAYEVTSFIRYLEVKRQMPGECIQLHTIQQSIGILRIHIESSCIEHCGMSGFELNYLVPFYHGV